MTTHKFSNAIPTNWLDPILTGDKACIGDPPYSCRDIENLLIRLRERIRILEAPKSKLKIDNAKQ